MADFQQSILVAAAQAAVDQPIVQEKRAQAAAVVDAYYQAKDTYTTVKPWLFIAGVVGAAASAAAVTKRRKVGEAWALYTTTGVLSAALAWFARPAALRSAPAPALAGPSWAATRAARLTATRPGWEAAAWDRLAHDFGTGTLNPVMQVVITRKTR